MKLFQNEPRNVWAIKAHYRPVIYLIKKEHGQDYRGSMPQVLAPILCPIWICRKGLFYSSGTPYIPRDVLSPQAEDKYTVADIYELDVFLTKNSVRSFSDNEIHSAVQSEDIVNEQEGLWKQYHKLAQNLYSEVFSGDRFKDFYVNLESGYVNKVDEVKGASTHILKLYDHLSESNEIPKLFEVYSRNIVTQHRPCLDADDTIKQRLGHSSQKFPLAIAQRDALSHALNLKTSEILAVNGPPGTGKTTFVLSVVASIWIESALKDQHPPFIIAASTNNQAVTNVIDAFGKDFDEGSDDLSGRWLPNISSYGGYFPSATKEDEAAKKYQTKQFYIELETLEYLDKADAEFLEKAQEVFPDVNMDNVDDVRKHLLSMLKKEEEELNKVQSCWKKYSIQKSTVELVLGDDPKTALETLKLEESVAEQTALETRDSLLDWRKYLAEESIWLSIFSFIPFIKEKREAKRKLFKSTALCSSTQNLNVDFRELETALEDTLCTQKKHADELKNNYSDGLHCYLELQALKDEWVSLAYGYSGHKSPEYTPSIDEIDLALDVTVRFRMFRLAVHYWEARWLLACRETENLEELSSKTGLKVVIPRWQRRMMLTPCIVSTFHSLPSHMTYQQFVSKNNYDIKYLFNEIDLLIVDEGGQVSPEVAGAAFSLAKKALIIGDTKQIEPVRNVSERVDIGNLIRSGLIQKDCEYEKALSSGRSVVNGSVMHIAQKTSQYHYKQEADSGMFLEEHRRCYDEIISYCNELCYKELLIAKRGEMLSCSPYPPFGYLHVDGLPELFGGSRGNKLEAETIASWLATNRGEIEEYFGESLEKAVGIVTPFRAQVDIIQDACRAHGIEVKEEETKLTIGTVHALQGAERKLIIFSQVYTKHNNGNFIDDNESILNVAVSRAKDSFIVFGDMDVISATHTSKPRGLLAKYLFKNASNELNFESIKRPDLITLCGQPTLLNNAKEHDLFIMQLLDKTSKRINIISPWFIYDKLRSTGILTKMKSAVQRGILITIYTDKHFNTTIANRLDKNKQANFENSCLSLANLGVEVNVIDGLHSKVILADEKYMVVGSFNWFSAAREGKYANVETSLAYSGNLSNETKTYLDFLEKRTYRRFARNANQNTQPA